METDNIHFIFQKYLNALYVSQLVSKEIDLDKLNIPFDLSKTPIQHLNDVIISAAQILTPTYDNNNSDSENEIMVPLHIHMCGCRFSSKFIFCMILLSKYTDIDNIYPFPFPYTSLMNESVLEFVQLYNNLFNGTHFQNILGATSRFHLLKGIEDLPPGYFLDLPDHYSRCKPPESIMELDDLYIVQVLKFFPDMFNKYCSTHTFLIARNTDNITCCVISSWFDGLPSTHFTFPTIKYFKCSDIVTIFNPTNLCNDDAAQAIFGHGNIFTRNSGSNTQLAVAYFSRNFILQTMNREDLNHELIKFLDSIPPPIPIQTAGTITKIKTRNYRKSNSRKKKFRKYIPAIKNFTKKNNK